MLYKCIIGTQGERKKYYSNSDIHKVQEAVNIQLNRRPKNQTYLSSSGETAAGDFQTWNCLR